MGSRFTARQGQYLAFIHRFTVRRGVAPSFDEIAAHFGVSSPSVNGMIKGLARRGLLSRRPGAARSLRVLVPASDLPDVDYGSRGGGSPKAGSGGGAGVSPEDAAATGAIAALELLLPMLPDERDASYHIVETAEAVRSALLERGLSEDQAGHAAARIATEGSHRRTYVRKRRWARRR